MRSLEPLRASEYAAVRSFGIPCMPVQRRVSTISVPRAEDVIDLDKRARISGGHRAIPMGLISFAIAIDLDRSC